MAVGVSRRRTNPYGATSLFGYGQEPIPFLGAEDVQGVAPVDDTQGPQQEQPQLIEPIASDGADFLNQAVGAEQNDYPSEASIARRAKLAQALIESGSREGEINHPMQAIARAVDKIAGSYMQRKAEEDQTAAGKRRQDAFKSALTGEGDIRSKALAMTQSSDPDVVEQGLQILLQLETKGKGRGGAPTVRDFTEGDQTVAKQWNDEAGTWDEVARGPRYKPQSGGGGGGGGSDGFAPTAQGANFALPDGKIVSAPFQKGRGFIYRDPETGEWKDVPANARRMTDSVGGGLSPSQYLALKTKRTENVNALRSINAYAKQAGGLPQGYQRWANGLAARWKTFLGSQGLSQSEFDQLEAGAKQQALLGMLRTTIVGPGVMTEYDAMRVIEAMGGNPGSAMQNPAVMASILQNLYERKKAELATQDEELKRNAPFYGDTYEAPDVPENIVPPSSAKKTYAPGDTRVIGGKTFKMGPDGNWTEVIGK